MTNRRSRLAPVARRSLDYGTVRQGLTDVTIRQALVDARRTLAEAGVDDPGFEAEVLLRDLLAKDRARFYLDIGDPLSPAQQAGLRRRIERRLDGEPTAYILGRREFYGRDFLVGPDVLVPRPETELLVEQTLAAAREYQAPRIAEVGTGSGAVAVSLALELPSATVYATDLSPRALEVAAANCKRHGVAEQVVLLAGDLLDPVSVNIDIVAANLPYVATAELPRTVPVSREPRLALDGGNDGLDQVRRLCRQVAERQPGVSRLLLEIGQGQAGPLVDFLHRLLPGAGVEFFADLAGIDRVCSVRLP
ncbi:MAG: peptide chain release factor N(5)-glutamine methyltransferase [Dehalococcoidales bacterium]